MAPLAARMSLPAILNECQKTMTVEVHRKYARLLSQRRRDQPAELAEELLGFMRHAFVVSKREPAVERLVRFVVVLANERDADEAHEDDDAFLEELLWALLPLSEAADKSVRFRVCQLIASLLHGLSNDTGLADELFAELVSAMTERLRDRAPAARMQAARALARLQDPGEAGDFADDAATAALLSLLECDKHKDVRRAVVASVGVSVITIPALVERTRDSADEVRRTAFLTVANKVSLAALSIAQRATLLRRGLAERVDDVRKAALVMLGKFLKACRDDVVALLGALDVETHESVAETLLGELIAGGVIKPTDVALAGGANGLRRTEEAGLLTPELALYWRVICEALSDDASTLGSGAALGGGQAAAVAAASAAEKHEAFDAALPETMVEYCELVRRHTAGGAGARFASRQLLRLACRLDLSDAAASRAASALAEELLVQGPVAGTYGAGGRGDWERALVGFAVAVLGNNAPDVVFAAAASLCDGTESDDAHWVQALGIVVPLLESASSMRSAGGPAALRKLKDSLIMPAIQHATASIRRDGVRALGLLSMLEPPAISTVTLLRNAAACDARPVRTHAARALCDLALLYGPEKLDEALPTMSAGDVNADALATAALVPALLSWLIEPAEGLVASTSDVADEEEEELRTVAGEGLAKLLLLDAFGNGADCDAQAVRALSQLLLLMQEVDEHAHPRLAQCLTVFFPTYAAASAAHKRRLAAAVPLVLREAARRKYLPRLAAFMAQLMHVPTNASGSTDAADPSLDLGAEKLGKDLLCEALYAHQSCGRAVAVKAYVSALLRTACALPVRAPEVFAFSGLNNVAAQSVAVHDLLAHARLASARVTEKTLLKDLGAFTARLAALPGLHAAPAASEALVADMLLNVQQLSAPFPFAAVAAEAASSRPARSTKAAAAAKGSSATAGIAATRSRRTVVAAMPALSESEADDASDASVESEGDDSDASDEEAEPPARSAISTKQQAPAAPRAVLAPNVR